jgi:kynurenine 3-monooxygenase
LKPVKGISNDLTFRIANFLPDMRLPEAKARASLRSINLAMSARGIAAIEAVEPRAAERFLFDAIPMKGRMIHDDSCNQHSQLYDRHGQVSKLLAMIHF